MKEASCQISGIKLALWKKFRQMCIEEELPANKKLLQLIEEAVSMKTAGDNSIDTASIEKVERKING
jgi:hypothetical protein